MRLRRILAAAVAAVAVSGAGALVAPASAGVDSTGTRCWIDEGWLSVDGDGYIHVAEDPGTSPVHCVH